MMKRVLKISMALVLLTFTLEAATTVVDNKTKLEWQDDYSDNADSVKTATWIDAIAYCEALSLEGNSDWRLPNRYELQSLIDFKKFDPSIVDGFTTLYVDSNGRSTYWSATTKIAAVTQSWAMNFRYYNIYSLYKSTEHAVRCVRDAN